MPATPPILRIGNACGFWGDDPAAPARLVAQAPDLEVLTLDYLAEVSMSVLARQRERDPAGGGFPADFLDVVRSLAPLWRDGRRLTLVTNAGGLNPAGCGRAVAGILREAGCRGMKVGVVGGDDVARELRAAYDAEPATTAFAHAETGRPLADVFPALVTANAYLGAAPLVEALRRGADVVVTGRVADPSLTVAPCVHRFGWRWDAYDRLAGATVAGHLIECGTQVTGGISTDWLDLPDPAGIGYPVVEVSADGSCVVTKPPGTGGAVNERTVKEQLLYETGDPGAYLSPDCTASFLTLRVDDQGGDRVRVTGATGRAPPATYKVSATHRAGYRASATLTVVGRDAVAKAERCGAVVLERLKREGKAPARFHVECLGAGDAVPGVLPRRTDLFETVLRLTAHDADRTAVERFAKLIVPLVTAGPQGTTGYFDGRPAVREVFGYWPTVIPRERVTPAVDVIDV